ncbi:MAG: PAS domain S-box protein [Limisphaerales bacterium]
MKKRLLMMLAVAGLYYAGGALGWAVSGTPGHISLFWPSAGIALTAILFLGNEVWPGVLIASLFVNMTMGRFDLTSAIGIALGQTAEALIAAKLTRQVAKGTEVFNKAQDIFKFVLIIGTSSIVSASFTSITLVATSTWTLGHMPTGWSLAWLSSCASYLLVAPLLVVWVSRLQWKVELKLTGELVCLALLTIGSSEAVFQGWLPAPTPNYPHGYVIIPIVLWAALRYCQRGATLASATVTAIALWGTLRGHGPFGADDPHMALILLLPFLATINLTSLVAAAILSERQQSELQLRFVWENSLDGMRLVNEQGTILAVNHAYCNLMERSREQLEGQPLSIFSPESRREEILGKIKEYFRQRTIEPHLEKRLILAQGRKIHVEMSNSFLEQEGHTPLLLNTFRDTTKRRQGELRNAALSALGERLNRALSPLDAARILGEVSEGLFGWDAFTLNLFTPDERIQPVYNVDTVDGVRYIIPPQEMYTQFTERDRRIIQKGGELILKKEPIQFSTDSEPFGNKAKPSASIMYVPIRNATQVVGLLSVQSYQPNAFDDEDLSMLQTLADYCGVALERIRAETALRASDALKGAIMESALDCIITMDRDGRVMEFNSAAQKTFGYSREEAIGRDLAALIIPSEARQRHRDAISQYVASGSDFLMGRRIEIMAMRKDGTEFPAEMALTPIQIEGGPIFTGYLRDITERKRAEKAMREVPGQILQAQESERMRVARELHDSVNQILSSTKFRLDSVEEKDLVPNAVTADALTKAKGLLDRAMHEVWRISRNLRPSELDDLGLIPAVRSLCSEFMHRTGVNVDLSLPRTVQLSPNLELTIYRIMQEALNNVEKHSEATDVTLTLSETDTGLVMQIEDNGIGFKSPSANASNPRKKSGMGLVGIMERVAYVGGFVDFKSVPDKGALIEVKIPRLSPEISMRAEKMEELAIVRR